MRKELVFFLLLFFIGCQQAPRVKKKPIKDQCESYPKPRLIKYERLEDGDFRFELGFREAPRVILGFLWERPSGLYGDVDAHWYTDTRDQQSRIRVVLLTKGVPKPNFTLLIKPVGGNCCKLLEVRAAKVR